jgi:hypothetical protein
LPFVAAGTDNKISVAVNFRRAFEFKELAIPEVWDHRRKAALARVEGPEAAGGLHGSIALVRRQPREKVFSVRLLFRALGCRPCFP